MKPNILYDFFLKTGLFISFYICKKSAFIEHNVFISKMKYHIEVVVKHLTVKMIWKKCSGSIRYIKIESCLLKKGYSANRQCDKYHLEVVVNI